MTKLLVFITLALVATIVGVSFLGQDTGYVYIKVQGINIELSLLLLIVLVLAFAIVFHYFWRFLSKTFGAKKEWQRWQAQRNLEHAHKKLSKGFVALGEGDYQKAQKQLSQAAQRSDYSLVPWLGAANAAQQRGDEESRDFFLSKALEENPQAKTSLALTKADHLVAVGKYKEAQFVLDELGKKSANNPVALRIQANIYARSAQWDKLLPLVPKLYKKTNLNHEEIQQLEYQAHQVGLANADGMTELQARWKKLPKPMYQQKTAVLEYVHKLTRHEEFTDAGKQLLLALQHDWDEEYALLYAKLPLTNDTKQIRQVEEWVGEHADSSKLNLALAQLYIKKELWVMAQDKLQASLKVAPSVEAEALLGQIQTKLLAHED